MRSLIISIFLFLVLVVTPKHVFAEPLSDDLPHIDVADIFYAPLFNDTGIFGAFGGYCGGDSNNQIVDWSIGNTIPHSGSMTDDIVFSTSVGHYMSPANWNERMRITKEGNVGIGTTNPTSRLQVDGNVDINSDLDVDNGTFHVNGTSGNVGIGTVSPTAKLHVSGTPGVDGIMFPDGSLQTTAASGPWSQKLPAAERFKLVLGDAAVLDKETGLVWDKSPDTTQRTWTSAISHCYTREIGGRKGWRLPTVEQLASLVDNTQSNPSLPSGHPFSNVQSALYWSSTTSAVQTAHAWGVDFSVGGVNDDGSKGSDGRVWCVRGGQGYDAY